MLGRNELCRSDNNVREKKFDRVVAVTALMISLLTAGLTSPVLYDKYITPKLNSSYSKLSGGGFKIIVINNGYKKASGVVIEMADTVNSISGKPIAIDNLLFIPPKEYTIVTQRLFTLLKLSESILSGEEITIFIDTQLSEKSKDELWLRVRTDDKNFGRPILK